MLNDVRVDVGGFQRVKAATSIEGINVSHHSTGLVGSHPSAGEKFLCPAAELVAGPAASGNLLDGIAVADPAKVAAPETSVDNGEGPASCSNLADKGVAVGFGIRAAV